MPSKQIWEHEVTYHPENVQDKSTAHNNDLRIYLPQTLEKLGLWTGDNVVLEKKKSEHGPYILGRKPRGDEPPQSIYQIYKAPARITLPSKWVPEFIQHGGEDVLIVEVNTIDDEFRVYRYNDYEARQSELEDRGNTPRPGQPIAIPLTAAILSREEDSSSLRDGFGDDIDDEPPKKNV